jgi:putative ABC transport system permease protein
MAWRETRAGWRHLVPLLVCVTLGVAALVSVGSFAAALDATLAREAKSLLGGDLELRSARPLDPEAEAALAGLTDRGAAVARVRELAGMARAGDGRSLLTELKAVDDRYPLYGRLGAEPARPLPDLLRDRGALVEPALLARLGLVVGDQLAVGETTLTIRGVIENEPDRASGMVTLGPRILIAAPVLDESGLIRPGSRVRYRALLRLPESMAPRAAREALARDLADPAVRVAAYDEAQPGLRRFFTQLTTYLGLAGLASLFQGGIGVAAAVTTFVRRRRPTIAVLKCLGAESRTLVATYLLQSLALGLVGSLAGAALGIAAQPLLARAVAGMLPFAVEWRADPATLARAVAMGAATTVLCALWPLGGIRSVPPSVILRREVEPRQLPRRPWPLALPLVAGLAALAFWQAGSLKVGAIFIGAALAASLTLEALAWLLVRVAGSMTARRGFAWRHGLAGLRRPGGQTAGVVVALGVGVMLLMALALLEGSLGRQMDHERRQETPSFFFIDIQPDQRERFARVVRGAAGVEPALTPIVRARLAAINGVPVTRGMIDGRRERGDDKTWYLTRDYALTWASEAPASNVVTRGRWWTAAEADARPRASVEVDAARYLGVDLGGVLAFDIQGVRIEAEVMSLRKVDWQTLSTNFFVIVSPGALDGAPTTFVATARVPAGAEGAVQDAVVAALPNVTAIPVRDVLERVAALMDQIAVAIRAVALVSITAGLTVMAGTVAASRYQRVYESVILRTLGATRGAVARAFAVEYACVGAAAGAGGTLLAVALAWVVLRFVLDTPWSLAPGALVLGVTLTMALALAVGFLGAWRLLGEKPLLVLRQE